MDFNNQIFNRKKQRMKAIIKIVSIIIFCLSLPDARAQTNTRVIGRLKDLKAGTVVYLIPSSSRFKKDSVVAKKGKFEFNLALEEGDSYSLKIGKEVPRPGNIN